MEMMVKKYIMLGYDDIRDLKTAMGASRLPDNAYMRHLMLWAIAEDIAGRVPKPAEPPIPERKLTARERIAEGNERIMQMRREHTERVRAKYEAERQQKKIEAEAKMAAREREGREWRRK